MGSPYDLIKITAHDLVSFKKDAPRSKIGIILNLVYEELPLKLRPSIQFITPYLRPIEGFTDNNIQGYEVVISENKKIEKFVREFIPFFILEKGNSSKGSNRDV